MKVYLAGKISKNDWRCSLVYQPDSYEEWRTTEALRLVDSSDICTGPFYVRCDHGCAHVCGTHGAVDLCGGDPVNGEVIEKSMRGIRLADVVFCFADTDFATANGTHTELGYAKAANKPIVILRHTMLGPTDAWFPLALASITLYGNDPVAELKKLLTVASSVSRGARMELRKELAERRKREDEIEKTVHCEDGE